MDLSNNIELSGKNTILEFGIPSAVRSMNTTTRGEPFSRSVVDAVWEKAQKEFGFFFFRKDCCSDVIKKQEYGKKTKYGWEIDHIVPVALGGTDDLDNLQPLHWENNVAKGNYYPNWAHKQKV
ncbi:MAG: HNH endonuclease signature motif containing protein [Bacteroidota bacterium]|nr:HNH endonuclease signature motif containing protein [Bacteroidota bacterium]